MQPATIPAIALYNVRAFAGIVVRCIVVLIPVATLMFVRFVDIKSNVFSLPTPYFPFVLSGTETGRSRRRSAKGKRRAEQRNELIDCKQNQYNLFEGYMCRTIKDFLLYTRYHSLRCVMCMQTMVQI